MELIFNKNHWIKVQTDTNGRYKILKCSDRILSEGSPFKDLGFAIIYNGLSLEDAEEYAHAEYDHMVRKLI